MDGVTGSMVAALVGPLAVDARRRAGVQREICPGQGQPFARQHLGVFGAEPY
jgi:hypothetical protein